METLQYAIRKLLYSIPLLFGVTLLSFTLMVYAGPDLTYTILGKNPTPGQIAEIRAELGYDLPFLQRYWLFLKEVATFGFGSSPARIGWAARSANPRIFWATWSLNG